jgi:type IV pilus assembly protein PilC
MRSAYTGGQRLPTFSPRVKPQEIAQSTRSLAVLVEARMPLARALGLVAEQTESSGLASTFRSVHNDVEAGESLENSLSKHPDTFSSLYRHLVYVGETTGSLGSMLYRLADHLERAYELKRDIRLALIYPGLILTVALFVVVFMLVAIVPMFASMFNDFGAELPSLTSFVIELSDALQEYALVIGFALLSLCLVALWLAKQESIRRVCDRFLLHVPMIGGMILKANAARFCRTLGILTERGIPFDDAVGMLPNAIQNCHLRRELRHIHEAVVRGERLSECLEGTQFPPLVKHMMQVGEETARIDEVLLRTATLYEDEIDAQTDTMTSVLEPLLILGVGVIVAVILIALYLPIMDLVTVIG